MLRALIGGIVGGAVLFAWGYVSWMVLPWHKDTLHHFRNDAAVVKVLKAEAPTSGIYILPSEKGDANKKLAEGPLVFASVHQEGVPPMNQALWIEFAVQAVAAFLVSLLLMQTAGLGYLRRIGFILVFAFTTGMLTHGMYWNWFKFSQDYTMVAMGDLLAGWFLAGIVIAAIASGRKGYRS